MGSRGDAGDVPVRRLEEAPRAPPTGRGSHFREEGAMNDSDVRTVGEQLVSVPAGAVTLEGNLSLPEEARAVVLFAQGSGSSRHSSRNRYVARVLNEQSWQPR
jgi:hypothetical protein